MEFLFKFKRLLKNIKMRFNKPTTTILLKKNRNKYSIYITTNNYELAFVGVNLIFYFLFLIFVYLRLKRIQFKIS